MEPPGDDRACSREVHIFVNLNVREIRFYQTEMGRSPVEEFLDALAGKQTQKLIWVLRLVEDLPLVPVQYFRKLTDTDELWEVRAQHGGDVLRLLGFFDGGGLLVLVSGFTKKSEKTPPEEIARAERRRRDYLSRKETHE